MKINSSSLSNLLLPNKIVPKAVLIYGPEEPEVLSVKQKILHFLSKTQAEPLEIISIPYTNLKENPLLLRDELASLSFFSSKKIILVTECQTTISKDLCSIIKNNGSDSIIIFIASDLAKTSSLRKFFEEEKPFYAIACYKPNASSLKQTIREYLQAHHINFTNDIIEAIASMLPANANIVKNELEKLLLFIAPNKDIKYEDLIKVIGENSESSFDELCLALITKNAKNLYLCLHNLQNLDANFMFIIRVIANFWVKVIKVKLMVNEGKSIEQATSLLKPPVFFKQRDNVLLAAKKFSLDEAKESLAKIVEIERKFKQGLAIQPELVLYQELIPIP